MLWTTAKSTDGESRDSQAGNQDASGGVEITWVDDVDGSIDGRIENLSTVAKSGKSKKINLTKSKKSNLTRFKKSNLAMLKKLTLLKNVIKVNLTGTDFLIFKIKQAFLYL